jgi:hypothetical protein
MLRRYGPGIKRELRDELRTFFVKECSSLGQIKGIQGVFSPVLDLAFHFRPRPHPPQTLVTFEFLTRLHHATISGTRRKTIKCG